jgi:hypothetical protein
MKLTHDLGLVTNGGGGVGLVHLITDVIEVEEVGGLGPLQERETGDKMCENKPTTMITSGRDEGD